MESLPRLASVAILVRDYDEALAFYTRVLEFSVATDRTLADGKRWVEIAPRGGGTRLLLAQAKNLQEEAAIGNQSGGRVFLLLHTDDFMRDYTRMKEAQVHFEEAARHETYGTVAVFRDLYGNRWDLLQPAS